MGTNHTDREPPVEVLRRWEDHGAVWRAAHISDEWAIVDLCTCHGEPVERLESGDPELIRLLRERPSSE
jgi:hypothetical protein